MDAGILARCLQCLLVVGDGGIRLVLVQIEIAQIVVSIGEIRFQAQGFLVGFFRLLLLALCKKRAAQVVVGFRNVGFQFEHG